MSKILALDLGDRWVGVAISDALGILARPLTTVAIEEIEQFLEKTISQEKIQVIVVGNPITMRGTESDQTKRIHEQAARLKERFLAQEWVLWDERLSSKQAANLKPSIGKEARREVHARAAALILQTYLMFLAARTPQ